jgi:hypothetical protein
VNYCSHISTVGNDTDGGSSIGPVSEYNLMLLRLFVVFTLFLYKLSVNTNNLHNDIILLILNNSMIFLMNFEIKIYHKIQILTRCLCRSVKETLPPALGSTSAPPPVFDGATR